jgi:iturin family lipopeptide synthetase A
MHFFFRLKTGSIQKGSFMKELTETIEHLMSQQLSLLSQVMSQQLAIIQNWTAQTCEKPANQLQSLTTPGRIPEIQESSSINSAMNAEIAEIIISASKESSEDGPESVPLSEAQKQLWLLICQEDNASAAYNETVAVTLAGKLQPVELHSAIQSVVKRHEALRTTIDAAGEWQHIQPHLEIELPLIDFSETSSFEANKLIEQWLKEENQRTFHLVEGPLLRFSLLKLEEQQHILVLSIHQIVVDSWSIDLILQEINTYYTTACRKSTCELDLPMQFRDYITQQNQQQHTVEASWLAEFQEPLPYLKLPIDRPAPARQSFHGARVSTLFDEQLSNQLKQLSKRYGCTLFVTLLAGYTALLHRITGQDDVIIGVPVSGRHLPGSENLVGYCSNLIPLRSILSSEETFLEHLDSTKNTWLNSYERHSYPFATFINKLQSSRNTPRVPLINAIFNLDRANSELAMYNLTARLLLPPISYTKFDLSVNIIDNSNTLLVQFDYNPDLFDEISIQYLQMRFRTFFEKIVTRIAQPLQDIPIVQSEEIQQQFIEWNATWRLYPLDRGVHRLFEAQVRKNPTAIAIEEQNKHISYQELNRRANQLAHYLKQQNIQPEQCVGILCERSIEQIIAILGTIKAGGVYLPIDPEYPLEQTKFILQEAEVSLIVSQQHLKTWTSELEIAVLCLDDNDDQGKLAEQKETNPPSEIDTGQLAYVIYTSDSTTVPQKGVQITHRSLLNLVYWHLQSFSISSKDSATLIASPACDTSVWELWPYLIAGARLKIPDEVTCLSAQALHDWLIEQQVNLCFLPAPLAEAILTLPWPEEMALRTVFTRGEVLQQLAASPPFKLYNTYGPTEQTVITTSIEVQPDENRSPTIGRPIANTQVYILDEKQSPVPIGMPGELYIGGDGQARGYLKHPELSAERFIPHPYSLTPGTRLYRTSDRFRYRTDGTLEFLGHIDQHEKKSEIQNYKVVLNHEGQYSIWPMDHDNPLGWNDAGKSGSKAECLNYIKETWTDMHPLSLRKKLEEAKRQDQAELCL